jgi:hypothetical protein
MTPPPTLSLTPQQPRSISDAQHAANTTHSSKLMIQNTGRPPPGLIHVVPRPRGVVGAPAPLPRGPRHGVVALEGVAVGVRVRVRVGHDVVGPAVEGHGVIDAHTQAHTWPRRELRRGAVR